MSALIGLDGIWKSYGEVPALRGVSLAVSGGDALVLTGLSGAGKSTLLRLIFAADRPDRGELTVAGRDLSKLQSSSIPYLRRNIGVVFQDGKLLPERSAIENVALALEILGISRRETLERAHAALESVGLAHASELPAGRLSGGEQQRIAVARAIVSEPSIVLCDEPTGNLDPKHTAELLELLEGLHLRGTTLLIATHDPQVIDFGSAHRWRQARLVAGELIDVDLPVGRLARLDEETEGFALRKEADATQLIRLRALPETPRLKVVP